MPIKIIDAVNDPTTEAKIAAFAIARGIDLPGRYMEFLVASNGGVPDKSLFQIEGMPLNPMGDIQVFFGVDAFHETEDLAATYDAFSSGFPKGIVPIASTGCDDLVCLDLRDGKDRVVFLDKRHYWGTGEWREADLYHVADSFGEFLASLKPNTF